MLLYDEYVTYDHQTGSQKYACCPLHAEKSPSFTVNEDTHEWYCHGCGRGGAEVEFLTLYYDVSSKVAKYLFSKWEQKQTIPLPSDEYITLCQKELQIQKRDLDALHSFGITDETIEKYKLGYDDCRITIPIYSRTGHCINVRKYLPPFRRLGVARTPKCINIKGLGGVRYFPYEAFSDTSNEIYIVEGEKDCLVARSQGLNAVTSTGGSAIPVDELALFHNKHVVLMLDTDNTGRTCTNKYINYLKCVAADIRIVTLPCKDYTEFYEQYGAQALTEYTVDAQQMMQQVADVEAQEVSLVQSEFNDHLNTWVKLRNMSVIGVEPKIYTVPTKLRATCHNSKCQKACPLALAGVDSELTTVDVDPRQIIQFTNSGDTAQDTYLRKMFGCRSVVAEPLDYVNIQKIIFQESASFIDGLDESSFESRYGIYMYTEKRLSATHKYDFETCRITDPRTQQNFYLIRKADNVSEVKPVASQDVLDRFQKVAEDCNSAQELIQKHYEEWMPSLAIEGRPDLFGAIILTYCSVTEIPWQSGIIKGWLDTMVIGDTRTGKSQMAQRFVKLLGLGGYINGENARRTGVIGGVQRFGDAWVITWGAIPMNDRGLLFIDEASGLEVDDVKDLSSTRSSGAVTMNKIIKGEARARTRLIWLSNPRSGRNISDFYWKGYGAFQEYIPVVEDQARYDIVLTAAREDLDVLDGIDSEMQPNLDAWRNLFNIAWNLESSEIVFPKGFKKDIRDTAHRLNDMYGGGPLVVGVAVHEKLLRLSCAFAVLTGCIEDGFLKVQKTHLQYAEEFLSLTFDKPSFGYSDYINEFKRAQKKREENIVFVRALVSQHPAMKAILSSSGFKGNQFREILGLEPHESAKIMSELITKGLLRLTSNSVYIPDKMLMEIAKEMEV